MDNMFMHYAGPPMDGNGRGFSACGKRIDASGSKEKATGNVTLVSCPVCLNYCNNFVAEYELPVAKERLNRKI